MTEDNDGSETAPITTTTTVLRRWQSTRSNGANDIISGPWSVIWEIPAEAEERHLNSLIEAAQNDEWWSDDFIAVDEDRIEVQQQQPGIADATEIVPVLAGLTDQSRTRLNPKTVEIYGAGLQSMDIDYITPIQSILKQENNTLFTLKKGKFDLTFILMPSVGKAPSFRNSAGTHYSSPACWNSIQVSCNILTKMNLTFTFHLK
jgi:hypothetical protein